mgnify:FL=1
MSIWFYLFIIVCIITIILVIKIIVMKNGIKEIEEKFDFVIKSDTNSLITISTNDSNLKNLAKKINLNLKKIRKLEIQYNQGNEELKRSITNISHDLRTPLTAIRGYLDLIGDNNLSKKQKDYLSYIDDKTKILITLTEQLFNFSKSLEVYKNIDKQDVVLNNILEETICTFYDLFIQNNIIPRISITKEKIIKRINKDMLKRILENIISNAIKYSDEFLEIKLNKDRTIVFKNRTNNLDKTSVEKIFDRYYTVENARKSNGIGLSIAKQLVELNNGTISAKYDNGYLIIEIFFL